jgi:hypothetical protein
VTIQIHISIVFFRIPQKVTEGGRWLRKSEPDKHENNDGKSGYESHGQSYTPDA